MCKGNFEIRRFLLGRDDGRLDVFVVLAEVLDEVGEIVEAVEVGRA